MQITNLGNTGLRVSRLCLGMMSYGSSEWRDWVLDYDDALPFVERALEHGINFFDTADVYSLGESERVLGRAIRDLGLDREDVVVATKCFGGTHERRENRWGLSRKHIMAACDASLERLGTEYIDLYQIHSFDFRAPVEETVDALSDLVRAGKVRYLGASNLAAWHMAKYLFTADTRNGVRFVSMQNHLNLLWREEEKEMIPLCRDQGIGIIPWSPQARGRLARTRQQLEATRRGQSDVFTPAIYANAEPEIVERNAILAERLGVAPAQVALAWVLQKPGVVSPIVGATKISHLDQAVEALDLELSADDRSWLEELYKPQALPMARNRA